LKNGLFFTKNFVKFFVKNVAWCSILWYNGKGTVKMIQIIRKGSDNKL
jgi:hypothetical protein